jgi:hypothetical protein
MSSPFFTRPAVPTDLAFIYRTWLSDLRDADRSPLPNDIWYPAHREAITRALGNPDVHVDILTTSEDPDEILGYSVYEPKVVLHWVYLRPDLRNRRLGLVGSLLNQVPPGTPASWQIPSGKPLRNPPRPRWARARYASSSTGTSK